MPMGDDPLDRKDLQEPIDSPPWLFFDGSHLQLATGGQRHHYPATSGKLATPHRSGYSLPRQRLAEGPIPEGAYRLDLKARDLAQPDGQPSPPSSAVSDPYRIDLHPLPATETYGRSGFSIHGGSAAGGAGGIDLSDHLDRFVADLRRALGGQTQPGPIHIEVLYPTLGDFPLPEDGTRLT